MSYKEELLNKFKNLILNISLEKEKNDFFLRIIVNEQDLEKIIKISKEISIFLNKFDDELPYKYFLDISSKGKDLLIDKKDLKKYENKYIQIELREAKIQGLLFRIEKNFLILKVNFKGQFKKIKYDFSNIQKIFKAIR